MKKILSVLLFYFLLLSASGQIRPVPYGKNGAAGKYYAVRGIKMYTEVYGKGKPLLLIHGNGGSMEAFTETIPYFSKKYKVIAVDSRAQGKTADEGDSLSFEMMADDFAALLTAMHIDSAYVIGWSDGGINAILLAMRHPEKVIKLAATGANMNVDSMALLPSNRKADLEEFELNKNKPRHTAKEKNDWKIFMLDLVQPNVPLKDLHIIQCPSLIICGDHDLIPVEHTLGIAKNIPKAYLWVIPDSGHGTLQEHRDEFNKTVDHFFTVPFQNQHGDFSIF